jgi:hypothetical protein
MIIRELTMAQPNKKKRKIAESSDISDAQRLAEEVLDAGFSEEERTALEARLRPGHPLPPLDPAASKRFMVAAMYADFLWDSTTHWYSGLDQWLAQYAPSEAKRSNTTCFKWCITAAGGYQGGKYSETIPNQAIAFLELVNPTIQLTAGKHDYWSTTWKEWDRESYDGVRQKPDATDMDPAVWETSGSGVWHDAVDDHCGWSAYNFFIKSHGALTADARDSQTLALWNHDEEKAAYKTRCAERRERVKMPAATALLRATTSATDNVDLERFNKVFPGCPFDGAHPWSVGGVLARYYGLMHMNQLPKKRWNEPYEHYFAKYARHFDGECDLSDYELEHLDPAHPDK